MKKIFRNSRLIAIAFMTLFLSGSVLANPADSISSDSQVELKLIGSYHNQSIFQLVVTGTPQQDNFLLIVRDAYGNSFYRENIKAENFSKKFLFDTEELGNDTLELEVYNRRTKKSVVYQINRNYKRIEEVVISKL